jgi:hypothetical protein
MALMINILAMIIAVAITLKTILQSIQALREEPITEVFIELYKFLLGLY